eukprot:PITA_01240
MEDLNLIPALDATCSTSTSHGNTSSYVYDVFINHRGPDVKKGLASHIYHRLKEHRLRVFLDQPELEEGENMAPQIEEAIRTASVSVAIFSPRYAESSWCLKELVLMLKSGSTIIPVFYKVEPSDLRWTRGRDRVYAEALGVLEEKITFDSQPRYDPTTIEKWRDALSAVADISGFELKACNDDEGQLVDEVVQKVLRSVQKPPLNVAKYPTGLDEKVRDVERTLSLQRQSGKARVVGIVGLGGVGKTTLAKEVFNREKSNDHRSNRDRPIYDRSSFLSDVRSRSLHDLQRILLKDLTPSNVHINNIDEGIVALKIHLSFFHRVLIVLDDVDNIDQMEALFSPIKDTIHLGSLILVTSRNKDVLRRSDIPESYIFELKGLNQHHSQELFCSHAFGHPYPVKGFGQLVQEFLAVCHGLPLSLKVLGSLLRGEKDLNRWELQLRKTSKTLPGDIQKTLKISYDALDNEERQIFLDIACFFIGENKDTAIRIWDGSNWEGSLGLWKLENRCLVEVDSENCLRMHDHLRDLGRHMAENPEYPRRLSRLADNLHNLSGQSSVRGISMVSGNAPEQCFKNLRCSCNLSSLELLMAKGSFVERVLSVGEVPQLIYLRWENCMISSLSFSIPISNLRVLYIKGENLKTLWRHESQAPLQLRELYICAPLSAVPGSIGKLKHLEKISLHEGDFESLPDEFRDMQSLKHLDLKYCKKMALLTDSVGQLTRLQSLNFCGCSTLQTLPESIGNLTGLQSLHLGGCSTLGTLPDSIGNLTSLRSLHLGGCSTLRAIPDSVGNLTGLQSVDLGECSSLQALPDLFGNLTGLQRLALDGCSSLRGLPDSIGNLMVLQSLSLWGCSTLRALPDSVGNLTGFQSLGLWGCSSLQTLPDSIGNLTGLQSLGLWGCSTLLELPYSIGNLTGLQRLDLGACSSLQALPKSVGNLTGLQHFDLDGCSTLQALPDSVGNLTGLQSLGLGGCSTLQFLPDSVGNLKGLQSLGLGGCSTLQALPDSVGNLTRLGNLDLWECSTLQALPDSVGNLTGLRNLDLWGCSTIQTLPESVENLTGLQSLRLWGCSTLQTLPDSIGNMTGLQSLNLSLCSALQALPDSVGKLAGLQSLRLAGCSTLQTLPESVGNLIGLRSLDLYWCSNLQALPESIGNLTGLHRLKLQGCSALRALPESVRNLTNLRNLYLNRCSKLQMLPNIEHLSLLETFDVSQCPKLQWDAGVVEQLRQRLGKGFIEKSLVGRLQGRK